MGRSLSNSIGSPAPGARWKVDRELPSSVVPCGNPAAGQSQKEKQVKVKDLNALLNKLNKTDGEKEITITYPEMFGEPAWEEPVVVTANERVYIVPKAIEDTIESDTPHEKVGQLLDEAYRSANAEE